MARVIAVTDGDTVTVVQGNRKTAIRLAGIDAPEKAQPWGFESRGALTKLVLRKEVRVTTKTVDDYGRVVAILEVGGDAGYPLLNVSDAQVRSGMAWASAYRADKRLVALQAAAQMARLGLWQQTTPVPPWEYRKAHASVNVPTHAEISRNTACGNKRHCEQMVSCEEAKFYLTQCKVKGLDKNGNGVPCERLCNAPAR